MHPQQLSLFVKQVNQANATISFFYKEQHVMGCALHWNRWHSNMHKAEMFISFLNGARQHIGFFFSPPKPLIMSIYLKTCNTVQSCPLLIREFGYRKQTKLVIFHQRQIDTARWSPSAISWEWNSTNIHWYNMFMCQFNVLYSQPGHIHIMTGWLCAQGMSPIFFFLKRSGNVHIYVVLPSLHGLLIPWVYTSRE